MPKHFLATMFLVAGATLLASPLASAFAEPYYHDGYYPPYYAPYPAYGYPAHGYHAPLENSVYYVPYWRRTNWQPYDWSYHGHHGWHHY